MYDIWMSLRKAKVDNRIKSLVLRLGYMQCEWAKVEEIREDIIKLYNAKNGHQNNKSREEGT